MIHTWYKILLIYSLKFVCKKKVWACLLKSTGSGGPRRWFGGVD